MSIFGRLLLSFVAAYLLSLAVTVFVAFPLWQNIQPARQVTDFGKQALTIYQRDGERALSNWLHDIRRKDHSYGLLVNSSGHILPKGAPPMPRPFRRHLRRMLDGTERISLPHGGLLMSVTLSDDAGETWRWIALVPPKRGSRLPYLLLRLGIGVLVLAIAAWLVSRVLTRPISQLRQASQSLADGDLETRTNPALSSRADELGSLAGDFDRMAERLQTLIETHRRLLRDVSHELRSPLSRLQVALELARTAQTGNDCADQKLLDRIGLEADRLDHMLNEVLTLSRLQQLDSATRFQDIDIQALVNDVIQDAVFEAQQRKITIRHTLSAAHCHGNPALLRRAVDNVLRNAVQYTSDDSEIEVTLDHVNDRVELKIADQGPGVPAEELERLFLPFHRVSTAREREAGNTSGGHGLGLAITANAVTAHGGRVLASSREGGGLIITITLPAQIQATPSS